MYPVYFYIDWAEIFYMKPELVVLGVFIYDHNRYSVFLIATILLIGLIGSISLVTEKSNIKKQYVHLQVNKYNSKLTKRF